MGLAALLIKRNCTPQAFLSLGKPFPDNKVFGTVQPTQCRGRRHLGGTGETAQRLRVIAGSMEQIAEPAMSCGEVRIERDAPPICGNCLLATTQALQGGAEIVMPNGKVGFEGGCPL